MVGPCGFGCVLVVHPYTARNGERGTETDRVRELITSTNTQIEGEDEKGRDK